MKSEIIQAVSGHSDLVGDRPKTRKPKIPKGTLMDFYALRSDLEQLSADYDNDRSASRADNIKRTLKRAIMRCNEYINQNPAH